MGTFTTTRIFEKRLGLTAVQALSVLLDASIHDLQGSGPVFDFSGFTIASDANALIVAVTQDAPTPDPTSIVWDFGGSNQAMTLIQHADQGSVGCSVFRLLAPTPGNKILRTTYDPGTDIYYMVAASFKNVNQTAAAAFTNVATRNDNLTSPNTLSVTGAGATSLIYGASGANSAIVSDNVTFGSTKLGATTFHVGLAAGITAGNGSSITAEDVGGTGVFGGMVGFSINP